MSDPSLKSDLRWYRLLNRYHWFVLIVAALGWLFDTMDQQLFVAARQPALRQLLGESPATTAPQASPGRPQESPAQTAPAQTAPAGPGGTPSASAASTADDKVKRWSGYVTAVFLIGWATGGMFFGIMGDLVGRAKTMMLTILVYSIFTGLSALSVGVYDFALYRFLTGLGVGGEFAVGVALVAEVMPDKARPYALAFLQALSAIGNISAALLNIATIQLARNEVIESQNAWRLLFVIGTVPALLALVIRGRLKEPEKWQKAVHGQSPWAAQKQLFARMAQSPELKKRLFFGVMLAAAGVIGLWGIGFFSPELIRTVLRKHFEAQGLSGDDLTYKVEVWASFNLILQNLGGFCGVYGYGLLTHWTNRRIAFAISFLAAMAATALVFMNFNAVSHIFWMIPLMGACQLSLFGGYAVYFPELFPTWFRSTGVSVCYNVGRYVAAIGPAIFGLLTSNVYAYAKTDADPAGPYRLAAVTMCSVFLLGLVALAFLPETKDRPLPE